MKKQFNKNKKQKFKSVPRFWWDYRSDPYTRDISVIVECSSQKGVIAEFKNVDIERSIAEAESLIKELERGNTSLKIAFDKYQQTQNYSSKLSQCHQYGLCAHAVKTGNMEGLFTTCDICPRNKE